MRIHVLVEGPSEERLLNGLLPRLLPGHHFKVHPHQGKGKLPREVHERPGKGDRGVLDQLAAKLRAFAKSLDPATDRVLVLVDLDDSDGGDCGVFMRRLNTFIESVDPRPEVLARVAIEEVEAWYLADWQAIKRAFKGAGRIAEYREYRQDSICGTWELFQRVIGDAAERKTQWAEAMGLELRVDNDRSPSFQAFKRALLRLCGEESK